MDFKQVNAYLMELIIYCFAFFAAIMMLVFIAANFTIFYTEPEEIEIAEDVRFCVDEKGKLKMMFS